MMRREKPGSMKIGTNLGELLSSVAPVINAGENEYRTKVLGQPAIEPKPQPRTRRAPLAPLSAAEIASRRADAHARAAELERRQRALNPVTFEIVHRKR